MTNRFHNTIDRQKLVTTLKMWTTLCDGECGSTFNVVQQIPYPRELDAVVPWDEMGDEFDQAIGPRHYFDMKKILDGDADELGRLDEWARSVADTIISVYDGVVAEANRRGGSI